MIMHLTQGVQSSTIPFMVVNFPSVSAFGQRFDPLNGSLRPSQSSDGINVLGLRRPSFRLDVSSISLAQVTSW
jgi:hypothetical protein